MNNTMQNHGLKRFNSDDFGAGFNAEIALKRASAAAFSQSLVFKRMCDAMRKNKRRISVHSEAASYFPAETMARVGWQFANKNDIDLFFAVMITRSNGYGGNDSQFDDSYCDDRVFNNYGLRVEVLHGPWTSITISNMAR